MKSLNWNEVTRFPCSVSLLNEALLRTIRDTYSKSTIVVTTGDKPWFDDRWSWLTLGSREHIDCGVVVGRRLIRRSIRWLVVMLSLCM